jgi:hypothetical protein
MQRNAIRSARVLSFTLSIMGLYSISTASPTPFGDSFTPTAVTGGFSMGGFESFAGNSSPEALASEGGGVYGDPQGNTYQATTLPGSPSTPALLLNLGTNEGYDNALVFDFAGAGLDSAFAANDNITFDVTYTAQSNGSGQDQLTQWTLNSSTGGFTQFSNGTNASGTNAIEGYPNGAQTTFVVTLNYDAEKASIDSGTPTYLQWIQGFQDYNGSYPTFYLSNFELTPVPDPASLSVVGLGSLGLIMRRRSRLSPTKE